MINLTNNVPLEIIIDTDADNSFQLSGFLAGTLADNWSLTVAEHINSDPIYTDNELGNITVDTQAMTVDVFIPANTLFPGRYYYLLKSDTEEITEKIRIGGPHQLRVIKA